MSFIQHQLTDKQKADNSSLTLLGALKLHCRLQFELAWKKRESGKLVNKTVSEAQAFFDSYGNKAALAFELHSKLQDLIYTTDNSWVPLVPPHTYVKNEDGTVTILEE